LHVALKVDVDPYSPLQGSMMHIAPHGVGSNDDLLATPQPSQQLLTTTQSLAALQLFSNGPPLLPVAVVAVVVLVVAEPPSPSSVEQLAAPRVSAVKSMASRCARMASC
jgi:hypothetical protein